MPDFRDILEPFGSQIQYPIAPYRKPTLNWRNKLPLSSLAIISDYLQSVLRSLLGSLEDSHFHTAPADHFPMLCPALRDQCAVPGVSPALPMLVNAVLSVCYSSKAGFGRFVIGGLEDGSETADSQSKTLLDVVSMFQCHADAGVKDSLE
ncbi:hypothetical protein V8C40DRAFT_237619 [Trichoderma camerunense]